ncbi:MAG: RCC1 repeat-containing protein, partial [Chloroflexi bacterium]|nr:RCC1 repeat-containing protein [Chloroflexota bacterium]
YVNGITTAISIAVGAYHSCAVLADGTARCWGLNALGELGNGTYDSSPTPVAVSNLSAVRDLAAGDYHTCATLADGTASCYNNAGQLGDGTTSVALVPRDVLEGGSPLQNAVSISAGQASTCTAIRGGAPRCWGSNSNGQLGDGTHTTALTAVAVHGMGEADAIALGGRSTCARNVSQSLYACWGKNDYGQSGEGLYGDATMPDFTILLDDLGFGRPANPSIAAGGSPPIWGHTCAVTSGGLVYCWGQNASGQLGNGTFGESTVPVMVQLPSWRARQVVAGIDHTCALLENGNVYCWGENQDRQLADGTTTDRSTPVLSFTGAVQLASTHKHTCAVRASGLAFCWGPNAAGELGTGVASAPPVSAVQVVGLTDIAAIAAGARATCALRADGTVRCWGINIDGRLGDGTTTDSLVPVEPIGLTNVSAIAMDWYNGCAISSGSVRCWGANSAGQIGDGGACGTECPTPVLLQNLSNVVDVAPSWQSVCALRVYGDVWCVSVHGDVGPSAPYRTLSFHS